MAKSKRSRLRVLMEKTPSPAEAANLIKANRW
jgi:hypothetical protein